MYMPSDGETAKSSAITSAEANVLLILSQLQPSFTNKPTEMRSSIEEPCTVLLFVGDVDALFKHFLI